MKKNILCLVAFLGFMDQSFSQVKAYPSFNDSEVLGTTCADLHYVNPIVIGHQTNVTIAYYKTLNDAQNETNVLVRFYESVSDPQTIYARVDSVLNLDFAIETCVLDAANAVGVPGGPPPGISPCYFDLCDVDSDGSEQINLNNLRCKYDGYGFPASMFCASMDSDVQTTYYLTQSDADNETNTITNGIFLVSGSHTFYRKIKNTNTNEFLIDSLLNVVLVNCSTDTDSDGIPDLVEDANNNLVYTDDDTDKDGLKNYEDADDDGDGILTINEDYNSNGNPADDDTNSNGIPDYLEASVTLSNQDFNNEVFKIYPNPTSNVLFVNSKESLKNGLLSIYDIHGKLVKEENATQMYLNKVNVSKLVKGVYFVHIKSSNLNKISKIIIN